MLKFGDIRDDDFLKADDKADFKLIFTERKSLLNITKIFRSKIFRFKICDLIFLFEIFRSELSWCEILR